MQEGWEKPLWLSKLLGENKTEILAKLDSIENIFKKAGDATATDSDIVKPKTAYNGNVLLTGTLEDKTGTENHAATASVDATNSRLKMQVPATAKYGVGNYLYATYSAIATLIGLTSSKLLAGNTILGVAGGIANKAGTTVKASAVTQDDNNTYFNVPAAGYYDKNSKVYTENSNLGEKEVVYAKTNGSYTSDNDEDLIVISSTGGLWNADYQPSVTGGTLTQLFYLNNYHDSWSCNTHVYKWSKSKGNTITFSKPISTDAYPVTMTIIK